MGTILPEYETPALKELAEYKNWVCWKLQKTTKGKSKKLPWTPYGTSASTMDDSQWAKYETCYTEVVQSKYHNTHKGLTGVGFVFCDNDPYVGIDLDNCRDIKTGRIDDWAADVIKKINSYTEVSQSGTGVHMICRGDRLDKGRNVKGNTPEMYSWGRFFTFTGKHVEGTPDGIHDRHKEVKALELECFGNNVKSSVGDEALPDEEFNIHDKNHVEKNLLDNLIDASKLFKDTWEHKRPEFDNDLSKYDASLATQVIEIGWGPAQVASLIASHRRTYTSGSGESYDKAFRIDYVRRTYFFALQCVQNRTDIETNEIKNIISMGNDEAVAELSQKLGISITSVIKRGDSPSTYYIIWEEREINLGGARELLIQNVVRAAIIDATNIVIKSKSSVRWLHMVELISSAAVYEKLEGAGLDGEILMMVSEYIESRDTSGENWKDAASASKPYIRDGKIYINMRSFRKYLSYSADYRLKPRELSLRLKQAGFSPEKIQCRDTHGNQVDKRYWCIELSKVDHKTPGSLKVGAERRN